MNFLLIFCEINVVLLLIIFSQLIKLDKFVMWVLVQAAVQERHAGCGWPGSERYTGALRLPTHLVDPRQGGGVFLVFLRSIFITF